MRTTSAILRAGRARIADPARWSSKGWGADGTECMLKALVMCGVDVDYRHPAVRALSRVCGGFPGVFNDSHTHGEVLAAWDQAIANEEAREGEMTDGPAPALALVG